MQGIARELASQGAILRSGAAAGADSAFECGAGEAKEIFLPWAGFNGSRSPLYRIPPAAFEIAARFHPAWQTLGGAVRKLMARNSQQVLGGELDHASGFVLCWTPDAVELGSETSVKTGGTGQAIRIASGHGVPVINMARAGWRNRLQEATDQAAAASRGRHKLAR